MSDYFDSKEIAAQNEAREQSELRALRDAVNDFSDVIVREADGGLAAAERLAELVHLPTLRRRLAAAKLRCEKTGYKLARAQETVRELRSEYDKERAKLVDLQRLVGE